MNAESPLLGGFNPDNPGFIEAAPKKEPTHELTVGAITFSGKSGTGKTSAATLLLERLQDVTGKTIPFNKAGELFREKVREESGQEVIGYSERKIDLDRWLDEEQVKLIRNATAEEPVLLEGRLAGFLTNKEKNTNPNVSAVTILFAGRIDIRTKRIWEREKKQNPKLSLRDVQRLTKERETGDLKKWQELHQELQGKDPFNPANKDENGKPAYDLIVNTNDMSVEEVTDYIFNWLLEKGYLKEVKKPEETQSIPLQKQGDIFVAEDPTVV